MYFSKTAKTLVFGHKNPDTDSICSALSMASLLHSLGANAQAARLGAVSKETQFALDYFGEQAPPLLNEDLSQESIHVVLVDHNEFPQSADSIEQACIDAVIDHHRIAHFETASPLYYRAEPVGCTSTILYRLFEEEKRTPEPKIAGLMLSAILSDTLLFQSPTCTLVDQQAGEALAKIAGVDSQTYGKELLRAGASIAGKTVQELLNTDRKPFSMGSFSLEIAQINVIGFEEALAMKEKLLSTMEKEQQERGLDFILLLITDIFDNDSIALISGDPSVAEKAFQTSVSDHRIWLPGVVSRKKQVVPPLTKAAETL